MKKVADVADAVDVADVADVIVIDVKRDVVVEDVVVELEDAVGAVGAVDSRRKIVLAFL